ncbi:MAG: hypothetical protein ACYC3S_09980 [Chloroflexota bacterium]
MNDEGTLNQRENLLAKLAKLESTLVDLEQEQRFTLGQTGVHLGAARVDYLRRSWASEEQRLRNEVNHTKHLLGLLENAGNG